ncbi:hypothetical protein [Roseiterribacter gracilis]|uniref:Uncharacterized protein n=1 Tax=Roseiterribacter gracilis TaxID=2812848 RepID=A0A8S8XAI2_9PROT|nr:hypothetical protein TMPK1_03830 [Rhodospirillales bacterium TMPK1]
MLKEQPHAPLFATLGLFALYVIATAAAVCLASEQNQAQVLAQMAASLFAILSVFLGIEAARRAGANQSARQRAGERRKIAAALASEVRAIQKTVIGKNTVQSYRDVAQNVREAWLLLPVGQYSGTPVFDKLIGDIGHFESGTIDRIIEMYHVTLTLRIQLMIARQAGEAGKFDYAERLLLSMANVIEENLDKLVALGDELNGLSAA